MKIRHQKSHLESARDHDVTTCREVDPLQPSGLEAQLLLVYWSRPNPKLKIELLSACST